MIGVGYDLMPSEDRVRAEGRKGVDRVAMLVYCSRLFTRRALPEAFYHVVHAACHCEGLSLSDGKDGVRLH